jgi:predicted MPP superfamily phosphohydrolase
MTRRRIMLNALSAGGRVRRWIGGRFFIPAAGALLVVALEVARANVLQPLHLRGVAQGPVSVLLCLSWLLLVPGDRLIDYLAQSPVVGRVISAVGVRNAFLATSLLIYFCGFHLMASLNQWLNRKLQRRPPPPTAPRSDSPAPNRPSRRRVLMMAKRTAVAGVAAAAAYPVFAEPHRLAVSRRSFPMRDLPPSLDGLRIVQLTDIHLGPWTSLGRVRRIVEHANALDADLIALTGDYVVRSPEYIPQVASALANLRARVGVVAVLGNHDWYLDGPLCASEIRRGGATPIDNTRLFLTPGRTLSDTPSGLCVAGVGDLWRDRQDYDAALGDLPPDMPRLLLSHNPDVAEEPAFLRSGHRVDLMLSGHTHGGQIRLPFVGAPVTMSRYGQKYARGLVQGPACPVFVCRGLGMVMLPVRFGSVPEIAVIELRRAP